uniref:G_PROTEIN_RECEP_F1_2 domain-containing protein n=1 Tax=Bursaphelenchus xylophilus TaxID=6326 RepID=A0A1I7RHU9_BURXY
MAFMDFYNEYHDRLIWAAVPGVIIILCSVAVGIFGNSNIVLATIRSGKTRQSVHILIAATAFSDILHQSSHVIFAINFFSLHTFTTLNNCFYQQVISFCGMNFGSFSYLTVGIDRLICITFPLRYNSINHVLYVGGLLCLPLMYSMTFLFLSINSMQGDENKLVLCFVTTPLNGNLGLYWNVAQWTTFASTIVCYSIVWLLIRSKKERYARKLTRSLTFIVSGIIFGWFITTLVNISAEKLGATDFDMFLVHTDFGWPANVAIAANFFIYYSTYPDYRKAFTEQLSVIGIKTGKRKRAIRSKPTMFGQENSKPVTN